MKRRKVIIWCVVIFAVIAVFLVLRLSMIRALEQMEIQTFTLEKTDLIDSVFVSGTVISNNTKYVYSNVVSYPVKEVYVEVGDKVKAGDVLARLDTTSLELDIKQTELNIRNAEETLKNEKASIESNLQKAINNLELASIDLEEAKKNYDKIKTKYEASASTEDEFSKAKTALQKAQLAYNNALIALEDVKSRNTASIENNIEIQKAALEKQKKMLNDSVIVSPIDGTVTMVNAKENGTASGLLFVIEDTDNLIASTAIGEYDIGLIKLGQEVIVRADGLGEKEIKGTVSEISPTAIKDPSGNTASTSNVQFETKITLTEKDPDLRIGMNVRLTIKLEEKKDVYAVPYDAVVMEADGNEYIYVLEEEKEESESGLSGMLKTRSNIIKARKIQVQTGLETDMYVEIISSELKDGMKVIIEPSQTQIASLGRQNRFLQRFGGGNGR